MKLTNSGIELRELIEKAIKNCVITYSDYAEVMKMANEDGFIDDHEQRLLSQLQDLLANGSLKRVKG